MENQYLTISNTQYILMIIIDIFIMKISYLCSFITKSAPLPIFFPDSLPSPRGSLDYIY